MTFEELAIGQSFRWPGGVTMFIKTGHWTARVAEQPHKYCHPSPWEKVVT